MGQAPLYMWCPLWFALITSYGSLCLAVAAVLIYFLMANITYSLNVLPDHDTQPSHEPLECKVDGTPPDWGRIQVRHSANWAGPAWAFVFGGINYQIEHHLFPRVHHRYFTAIAPIVRE